MTQADCKIREGLLALMCVGDNIYHLNTNSNGDITTMNGPYLNVIRTCTITEIVSKTKIRIQSKTGFFYQDTKWIDEYEGELYIWNARGWYFENNYEKRLEKMANVIKAKDTLHW